MRLLKGLIFAAVIALCGCASIPLSTALSLSSLSLRDLAQIDPAEVRVKLAVPEGYEIDIPASHLTLALDTSSASCRTSLDLALLSKTRERRPGGLFSPDVPVSTYLLALSPEGSDQLRELQRLILSGDPKKFEFSVNAPFAKIPPAAQEIRLWADLKLSLRDPFIPLFNGAKMPIKRA